MNNSWSKLNLSCTPIGFCKQTKDIEVLSEKVAALWEQSFPGHWNKRQQEFSRSEVTMTKTKDFLLLEIFQESTISLACFYIDPAENVNDDSPSKEHLENSKTRSGSY